MDFIKRHQEAQEEAFKKFCKSMGVPYEPPPEPKEVNINISVPDPLRREFKLRCSEHGTTMRDAIVSLMQLYVYGSMFNEFGFGD